MRNQIQGPLPYIEQDAAVASYINLSTISLSNLSFDLPPSTQHKMAQLYLPRHHVNFDKITPNRCFTVRSCYQQLTNQHHSPNSRHKWIWKLKIPPKIKTFLWLCSHGKIPIHQYLYSLGISSEPYCAFCHTKVETLHHLFITCPNATQCWHMMQMIPYLQAHASIHITTKSWMRQLINNPLRYFDHIPAHTANPFTMWHFWTTRNKLFFEKTYTLYNFSVILNHATEFYFLGTQHTTKK